MALEQDETASTYACRSCRRKLFAGADLEGHQVAQQGFTRRQARGGASKSACSSYFLVEPPDWVDGVGEVEGKILCPNPACGARVGSVKWAGAQCSCGTWVTPAVQFPHSKVDQCLPPAPGQTLPPGAVVHASVAGGSRPTRASPADDAQDLQADPCKAPIPGAGFLHASVAGGSGVARPSPADAARGAEPRGGGRH